MNYALTPIETVYKGYKFRSRLEARWAVFFEEMGFDWSYEVEGFNLPSGARYLPDFFIKNHEHCYDYWYEIKPEGADPCLKVAEFSVVLDSQNNYESGKKRQDIIQLAGDPMRAIQMVCPRCKRIETNEKCKRFTDFEEWYIIDDAEKGYKKSVLTPSTYECQKCDMTKGGDGVFDEEDGFKHKEFTSDLHWHKGLMEQNSDGNWAILYADISFSSTKARQERFDGRPS